MSPLWSAFQMRRKKKNQTPKKLPPVKAGFWVEDLSRRHVFRDSAEWHTFLSAFLLPLKKTVAHQARPLLPLSSDPGTVEPLEVTWCIPAVSLFSFAEI